MVGPNVKLSFEKKLRSSMETNNKTSFLDVSTCSSHPFAFRKRIKKVGIDLEEFFYDIHFFFKYSSAHRKDYAFVEEPIEVAAQYAMKHTENRWFTMKSDAVRILQQWKNLKEYFLKFLLKQSNFKSTVITIDRYKRISVALQNPLTKAYISFCAFSASDFEDFLLPFQSDEPKIHLLYPSMCKLASNLSAKFIRKRMLSGVESKNLLVDIYLKENRKLTVCRNRKKNQEYS